MRCEQGNPGHWLLNNDMSIRIPDPGSSYIHGAAHKTVDCHTSADLPLSAARILESFHRDVQSVPTCKIKDSIAVVF